MSVKVRHLPARLALASIVALATVAARAVLKDAAPATAPATMRYVAAGLDSLAFSLARLDTALADAGRDAQSAFRPARRQYKHLEAILLYLHPIETSTINGPRIEDDDAPNPLPRATPIGFQVVEAALFDGSVTRDSAAREVSAMRATVDRLRAMSANQPIDGPLTLDAARLELARVITLGLTGFDASSSGDALIESADALDGVRALVATVGPPPDRLRLLDTTLAAAAADLRAHPDFDTFDRLGFVVAYANPAARALARVRETIGLPASGPRRAWRVTAATLFEPDAFDPMAFAPGHARTATPALLTLGRRLFAESRLSGPPPGTRSCATCHDPARAFTDGRPRAQPLPGVTATLRNTPTLLGAAFQYTLFADDRARSLETQIGQVLESTAEMAGSADRAAAILDADPSYRAAFAHAMPDRHGAPITALEVRQALAVYLRSLTSLDSRFDRALRGDTLAMSTVERNGFRVFAGKARCATCHFMPLLNGVTPPDYVLAEPEVIGTTATSELAHPVIDRDPGRYAIDPVSINRFAFKVPTLRNVARTAPYMHNGAFATLEAVVDFYDRGGGAGLGLALPNQTLPPSPLHLSDDERRALVAFLGALTDPRYDAPATAGRGRTS